MFYRVGVHGKRSEAPASLPPPAEEPTIDSCALEWDALSAPWTDIRAMLNILASKIRDFAEDRGFGNDFEQCIFPLTTILMAFADRRMSHIEHQLAAHREEAAATQHLAGRFLANASHELRTPLTAVLGFAELLMEGTYGELAEEQRNAMMHIENSAQNLLEIINNLLDLLHIRSGKLTLQYRPVAMTPLLHNIYEILTPLANRKSVKFSLELADDLGMIEADENIVRHIVYHLLSSALRATPMGGQVCLRASRDGQRFIIVTHDTALHLPPEAIANMMDPFPILENSPARGYEGWEVGLPLVRRYVDLHAGTLDLESFPDKGTTFYIGLPVSRPDRSHPER